MASLDENLADGTIQDDGANVPRIEILADDIAGLVQTNRPAKRKRDKMDIQDNLQGPSQTATGENNGNNAKLSRNWKPPHGIITDGNLEEIYESLGSNSTMLKELRGHEVVHEFALRKTKDTIDLADKHKLEAAYIQLTGEQAQNPCKQCLAGKGPFELCVYGPARRCGNCYYRGVRAQCSFLKAEKENGDASARNPQNSQAVKEGTTGTSGRGKEETGSENKLAAPTSEAVSKPSQHADNDDSKSDTDLLSDLQCEVGIGGGLEHHPEPEPVYQVGGRQLRTRPPRLPPRNQRPWQRRQNTTATDTVLVGPNKGPQARHGSSTAFTNPTTNTNPATNTNRTTDTNPPANPPNSPSIRPGIDRPLSPPPATATPTRQALPSSGYQPQFPAAVASVVNAQIAHERCGCGPRDIRPERQQQNGNNTGLRGTETRDRDRDMTYSERDRADSRARRDTDTDTDRDRDREKGGERDRGSIINDRSYSLGGASPDPGPPNSILACLPPNTPVEIMRCLMQYHQDQADELRLEWMSISRSRSGLALWQRAERSDTDRDKDTRAFSRVAISGDAGPSSILECLGPNHSPLETMRRLGLHYQFQADELRLECVRIEREERMRRQRERKREWERERGGRGGGREEGAR